MDPNNAAPELGAQVPEIKPPIRPEQGGNETAPERPVEAPRFGPEQASRPERELPGQAGPPQPAPLAGDQPLPVAPATDDNDHGASPAVADDVELIEKAWVNKAKQVIAATHDDPHAQEAAFEKLQSEYLKKRYGYGKGLESAA